MRRDLVGDRRGSLSILSAPMIAAEISANVPVYPNSSAAQVTVGNAATISTDSDRLERFRDPGRGTTITTKTVNYDLSLVPSLCTGPVSKQPPPGMAWRGSTRR
jgi:hypothetical protein